VCGNRWDRGLGAIDPERDSYKPSTGAVKASKMSAKLAAGQTDN